MDDIKEVTGGSGGSAFLLIGKEKTALIDCGMAYCASALIRNCQAAIGTRTLDYILISHSHYDHIGAVPFLRQQWPDLQLLGDEHAKYVLSRPNALKAIRELSQQAAGIFGVETLPHYDDVQFRVDRTLQHGERVLLGGMDIQVIKTPGHTQCSLSFLVNGNTVFASESTGCFSHSGNVHPAFIRSYAETVHSIGICQKLNPRYIVSPHYGMISEEETPGYWAKCLHAAQKAYSFVMDLAHKGYSEEQILIYYEAAFRDEDNKREQPLAAFRLNAKAMVDRILLENWQASSLAK